MKVTVLGIGNAFSTGINSTAFLITQESGDKIKKSQQKRITIFHDCQIYDIEPPKILNTPHATYKHILISYPKEWIEKYIVGVHFGYQKKS